MKTIHRYLELYPIDPLSKKLILGTIHPHDHLKFQLDFFYGNEMSLWRILDEAFIGEFDRPLSISSIQKFLKRRQISVSDTIIECSRKSESALDEDLIPEKLNNKLVDDIRDSKIDEILFTSGFGVNNAFKLFYVDILNHKITRSLRDARGCFLEDPRFGRPIKLTVLYSPAGTSNVGLSKSKSFMEKAHLYNGMSTPVKRFKIDYYREMFS